jgi:hypothetical protein
MKTEKVLSHFSSEIEIPALCHGTQTFTVHRAMSDGGPRKRSADSGEGEAGGGQAAEGSAAKRPKPDAADAASAYAAAIKLVKNGEFPACVRNV